MKISINSEIAQKNGMTTQEVMLTMIIKSGVDIFQTLDDLVKRQVLVKDLFGGYSVTQRWAETCDNIALSSDSNIPSDEDLEPLALQMMEIVPQCKKEGTSSFFKCNKREIILKLKKFIELYGKYPDEEIIAATQKYVASFNGDYTYMKLLKYFILKEAKKVNAEGKGYIEETSDLATMLESKDCKRLMYNFDNGTVI